MKKHRETGSSGSFMRRSNLAAVLAAGIAVMPFAVSAQSNAQGFIYGSAPGGTVEAKSVETGYSTSVPVSSSGTFRFDSLPIGRYVVELKDASGKTSTQQVDVTISRGAQVRFEGVAANEPTQLDSITVTATNIALVDTVSTETSTSFSAAELERIPVPRNLSAVQLLAPDAVEGSGDYSSQQGHSLVSFGGASPLENAFYVNGFNVTDFRQGLGGAEVPFEFYKEINVRTGGYSAEFGRSIGGSISTVSKTGTNDFVAGGNVFWEPDWGREDYPDVYTPEGDPLFINNKDKRDSFEANIFASGPIIKDRLFFYALVGVPSLKTDSITTGASGFSNTKSDSPPFWAGNLLANIADGHQLQVTAFSDERDYEIKTQGYDFATGTKSSSPLDALTEQTFGGQYYVVNYTGQITSDLSLSLLYGRGERQEIATTSSAAGTPCSTIRDRRGSANVRLGCIPGSTSEDDIVDTREAYRVDGTYNFDLVGYHKLHFGYDREDLETDYNRRYSGDGFVYTYDTCEDAAGCSLGGETVANGSEFVGLRSFDFSGVFENQLTAYYVQDSWQITPRLLLDIGVRYDEFELFDAFGDSYLKLDGNWAPRLGVAYDLFGDGQTKVFANYGKYFLPIETNLAARALAIGEDRTQNYTFTSIDANGFPVGLNPIGTAFVDVGEGDQAYDQNIKATEQDEFIVGFETQLAPKVIFGVTGVYRDLVEAQEDTCYFDAGSGSYGCVLLNPGASPFIDGQDYDFDGVPDTLTLSNDVLLLPEVERKYYALQFDLKRVFDGKWEASVTYTWSHLFGNFEGFANSDIGQDDPGITIAFDNFALVAYGDLPSDRRHNLKARGSYMVTPELSLSGSFKLASGRPKNAFGLIPDGTPGFDPDPETNQLLIDLYNGAYEGEFAYTNGRPVGRGAQGRLDWTLSLDLGVSYSPQKVKGLTIGLDVFNVTDEDKATTTTEEFELQSGPNPEYGTPRYGNAFQTPRTIRLGARYEFNM